MVSSVYSACFATAPGPPIKNEQFIDMTQAADGMPETPSPPPVIITNSVSNVKKTLQKDTKALESRMSRFQMESVFPGVPTLNPLKDLRTPEPKITTLENGLRVATQEMYSPLCTFGVVIDAGSRDEEPGVNDGVCNLMEAMAFKSTTTRSQEQLVNELDDLGAIPSASCQREQVMMCVDVLRPSLPKAMELFADALINPAFEPAEVEDAKSVIELQLDTLAPELLVKELLQEAAYRGQSLGRSHFCTPQNLNNLASKELRAFKDTHFTAENMVLAAAGVHHDEFVALARKYMGGLPRGNGRMGPKRRPALYTGGEARLEMPDSTMNPNTRIAVGFEVAGWQTRTWCPCVCCRSCWGAAIPSRQEGRARACTRDCTAKSSTSAYWVEGAEAFVNIHNETGILGIAGSCDRQQAGRLMQEFCSQFAKLTTTPVEPIELSRARNMLKCNVLTQLESRIVLFEDVARQLVTYGHRDSPEVLCQKIDSVTAIDIMNIARRALSKPLSIASVGTSLDGVPTYLDVLKWFVKETVRKP